MKSIDDLKHELCAAIALAEGVPGRVAVAKLLTHPEYTKKEVLDGQNKLHGGGDTPLITAVKSGNRYLVSMLMSAGASIDALNDKGESALEAAVTKLDYSIIREILIANKKESTDPLRKAIIKKIDEKKITLSYTDSLQIKRLLNQTLDELSAEATTANMLFAPNSLQIDNALMKTVRETIRWDAGEAKNSVSLAEINRMLKAGADPNHVFVSASRDLSKFNYYPNLLLRHALGEKNSPLMELYFSYGGYLPQKQLLFSEALTFDQWQVLLDAGADVNDGSLIDAAFEHNSVSIELMNFLLAKGADVNRLVQESVTRVYWVWVSNLNKKNLESIPFNCNSKMQLGRTILMCLMVHENHFKYDREALSNSHESNRNLDAIQTLYSVLLGKKDIDLNIVDDNKDNIFHYLVRYGKNQIFAKLIEKNINSLCVANVDGCNAIHLIARYCRDNMLGEVIKLGVDKFPGFSDYNNKGYTPLHELAMHGQPDMLRKLCGVLTADQVNAKDLSQNSILGVALQRKDISMINAVLLVDKLDVSNENLIDAFTNILALKAENLKICSYPIMRPPYIDKVIESLMGDYKEESAQKLLDLAIKCNETDFIKAMLKTDASFNIKDESHETLLIKMMGKRLLGSVLDDESTQKVIKSLYSTNDTELLNATIQCAIQTQSISFLQAMLRGYDWLNCYQSGYTGINYPEILSRAIKNGSDIVISAVNEIGIEKSLFDMRGKEQALIVAVKHNRWQSASLLLEGGADPLSLDDPNAMKVAQRLNKNVHLMMAMMLYHVLKRMKLEYASPDAIESSYASNMKHLYKLMPDFDPLSQTHHDLQKKVNQQLIAYIKAQMDELKHNVAEQMNVLNFALGEPYETQLSKYLVACANDDDIKSLKNMRVSLKGKEPARVNVHVSEASAPTAPPSEFDDEPLFVNKPVALTQAIAPPFTTSDSNTATVTMTDNVEPPPSYDDAVPQANIPVPVTADVSLLMAAMEAFQAKYQEALEKQKLDYEAKFSALQMQIQANPPVPFDNAHNDSRIATLENKVVMLEKRIEEKDLLIETFRAQQIAAASVLASNPLLFSRPVPAVKKDNDADHAAGPSSLKKDD